MTKWNTPSLIFLTGFMGAGKSTLGPILADSLGTSFWDLDQEIEIRFHKTIPELIIEEGEGRFREKETETLNFLLDQNLVGVISLGGGTLLSSDNRKKIRNAGLCVYLRANPESLFARCQSQKKRRPLLEDGYRSSSLDQFLSLWEQRKELYQSMADFEFDTECSDGASPFDPEQVAEKLMVGLGEWTRLAR